VASTDKASREAYQSSYTSKAVHAKSKAKPKYRKPLFRSHFQHAHQREELSLNAGEWREVEPHAKPGTDKAVVLIHQQHLASDRQLALQLPKTEDLHVTKMLKI